MTFAYEPERPILKDVTFEVPAGQMVAIVGPSGAGKSTISRILFRFYDIQKGRVTIDGTDYPRRDAEARSGAAIGMVPQDTVLFNDTIVLQHPLRQARRERRRGARGRAAGPDRRLHPHAAAGLRRRWSASAA